MIDLLVAMVTFGFAAAGLGALVRASPWPARWLARKPLSCVACMAGHSAWISMVAAWCAGSYAAPDFAFFVFAWIGATGVASWLLAQTGLFVQGFAFEGGGEGESTVSPPSPPPHGP